MTRPHCFSCFCKADLERNIFSQSPHFHLRLQYFFFEINEDSPQFGVYVINVSFESAGVDEFSRAFCAFVRLLAVVSSKMHLQARLGDERLLTKGTLVFTNIQMAFLVSA